MRQFFYYKNVKVLFKNATIITKCDDSVTKCNVYYKSRRLLQNKSLHMFEKICVFDFIFEVYQKN